MEAKTKRTLVGLGLIIAGGTLAFLAWRKWGNKTDEEKKADEVDKEKELVEEKKKETGYTSPKPKANDSFPLQVGNRGSNVEKLQVALRNRFNLDLGKWGADGIFGGDTLRLVKSIGYPEQISKSDFDRILSGKYTASTATAPSSGLPKQTFKLEAGKLGFAKYGGTQVYRYGTGKFDHFTKKGADLGTISEVGSSNVVFGKDRFDKKYFVRSHNYVAVLT